MIDKEFVPYEPALELKELGFNEPCIMAYIGKDKQLYSNCDDFLHLNAIDVLNPLKAPTFSQAFRFFREVYGLHSYIDGAYPWFRYYINSEDDRWEGHKHLEFEEAELACLIKLIQIVKDGNK